MRNTLLLFILFAFALVSCNEGPAEEFGSQVDDAVTDTGNAIEDVCEDVADAVDAADQNC